ncbi:hypothetical protein AbraIFM66951_005656 [Aspergillus brasiliensis]|uniref:Uncharacterized protein n=1 Tax=Aspergillus brasiliensis TaxID=319629 RepID=A0A9W5Z3R7_9EURO|nr:hypothetical protein AbraCBS73388_004856 [Aspergillus brasiliensis]GKZ51405.1 hypothetical protein AbraIFM66951_005656 [Aspergillus brasiliensis]
MQTYFTVVTYIAVLNVLNTWLSPNAYNGIIPSIFKYNGRGQVMWGRAAANARGREPFVWVKMLLHGSPDVTEQHQNLREILGGTVELGNIGAGGVIGDFLRDLRETVWTSFPVLNPQIHWCFTEPDCWSDRGRLEFRSAVETFGWLGNNRSISYVSEALAAAEGAANEYRNGDGMQDGDVVLVCDCGGSTTDLAILRVNDNNGNRTFTSQRLEGPRSIRCGGFDVDRRIVQQLRAAHPDLPRDSRQWVHADQARRNISSVKENCVAGNDVDLMIEMRRGGQIHHVFTHAAVIQAFAPVVQEILGAIHAEITAPMNARITKVILAGGLSKSTYLRGEVDQDLARAYPNAGPRLLGPLQYSVQAVSRGAALWAARWQGVQAFESNSVIQLTVPWVERVGNELQEQTHTHVVIRPGRNVNWQGQLSVSMRFLLTAPDQYVTVSSIRQEQTDRLALGPITKPDQNPYLRLETGRQAGHEYQFRVDWKVQLGEPLFMQWTIRLEDPHNPVDPNAPIVVQMLHQISPEDLHPFPAV